MNAYNHAHPGSSLPLTRPGGARPVTYTGAWKDLLAILVLALFVIAAAISVIALTGSEVPNTAIHHGGPHGRVNILDQMKLSGTAETPSPGSARTLQDPEAV
jgi:hypothetical protein